MKLENYVEVKIPAFADAARLLELLDLSEALGSWEDEEFLHIYWTKGHWSPRILESLRETLVRLGAADAAARINVSILPDRDWNAEWRRSLWAIVIGRRLRIRQSWHKPDPDFDGIELVIDAKRAFGTGYHATTQLVLEWLEENIHGGERILDIGTGTGILAMAALRFGAGCARGIDNDPDAIECARENARVNRFGRELSFIRQSFENADLDDCDLVLANLDCNTLLRLLPWLRERFHPGSRACLSGLLIEDREAISETLHLSQAEAVWERKRDEWLAIEACFRGGSRLNQEGS